MSTDIEKLVVSLEANMRGYERSMQRAIGQTNQTARRIETRFETTSAKVNRGFQAMGRVGVQALGAIGVAVGGAQLARLTAGALQAAESIQDMSRQAGVSAEFLQEMRFAADQNGASARDFDDAMSRLNRRLGLFINDGGGPAAEAFETLGLATRITSGELNNAESVFEAAVTALEGVENGARRSAIASELFGDEAGPRLSQMLALGTAGLERFSQRARDAGLVLENELVSNGADVNAMLRAMRAELSTDFYRAVLENAEGIESLAQSVMGLVNGFLQAIGAAHRLGVEIRKLINLDPEQEERARQFSGAASRLRSGGASLTVGEMRGILRDELGSDEAARFIEMIGLTGTNRQRAADRLSDFTTADGSGLAAVAGLLDGFAEGARTQARIVAELEAVQVPGVVGIPAGAGGGGPSGPNFGPVNANGEIIASAPGRAKIGGGAAAITNAEADKAKALGLIQAEELASEIERNRSRFADEFAYTFAGGFRAAFDGDLADFAAQRLRDALAERLFSLFEGLGRTLFNAINGEGGGGVLATIGKAAFGGGKAAGGPVRAGMAYRVGERGPETIIPAQNGMVLPNAAMAPMRGNARPSGPMTIRLEVNEGAMFEARVVDVAGPLARQATVQAVATSRGDLVNLQKRQSRSLRG